MSEGPAARSWDGPALTSIIARQVEAVFPWYRPPDTLGAVVTESLERTESCIAGVGQPGYGSRQGRGFDPDHTDMYATFLYFVANTAWRRGDRETASRAYALNKALHALDVFYEVELPDVFLLIHPVGTVLGRATYGGRLVVYQGCTVGANLELERPVLGDGVALMAGSSILGRCVIGANTLIGSGVTVLDMDVAPNSVVIPGTGRPEVRPSRRNVAHRYFAEPASSSARSA